MAETIDGVLHQVLWHGPDRFSESGSKFLIGRLTNGQTVKGHLSLPRKGESYRFWGEFRPQKKYPDPAFEFDTCEVIVDQTTDGVAQYLRRYVDGLGHAKSEAIVEELGMETLTILRSEPERALAVRGITPAIVDAIRGHFDAIGRANPAVEARLIEMLARHRMPRSIVGKLMKLYPNDAPDRLAANPYILKAFPRMGWKTVDAFALEEVKFDRDGVERHAAAIDEAFLLLGRDGHTCATMAEVEARVRPLIGMAPRGEAWADLAAARKVVAYRPDEDGVRVVALAKFADAEREIASRIVDLATRALPLPGPLAVEGLGGEQMAAVRLVERHGVAIVTGSPGTGKSYSTGKIVAAMIEIGIDPGEILYIAPTGKAAKRGAELLAQHLPDGVSVTCSTIHRALAPRPSMAPEGVSARDAKMGRGRDALAFSKNEGSPLAHRVIFADEFSMCDCLLAASLLKAIAPGTRLILVGDENQLPSVGPGAVLRDLVAAGVPTVTLREIRRSESAGRVVHACHAIRDGRLPEPAEVARLPVDNWIHIEVDDPDAIARTIVDLHGATRFDPTWGMQVVSPQKDNHAFACNPLNARLAAQLNPAAAATMAEREASGEAERSFPPPFYAGDKVVRTENGACDLLVPPGIRVPEDDDAEDVDVHRVDWRWQGQPYRIVESYVVNGDMGTAIEVVEGDRDLFVVVRFRNPDRLIRLPYREAKLIQAYAMTGHKCQGSGYPFVVIPVHNAFYSGLVTREWIYTAISRAEEMLVTVGQFSAIRAAIGRKTVHLRKTKLASLLGDFGTVAREAAHGNAHGVGGEAVRSIGRPTGSTMLALPAPPARAIACDYTNI